MKVKFKVKKFILFLTLKVASYNKMSVRRNFCKTETPITQTIYLVPIQIHNQCELCLGKNSVRTEELDYPKRFHLSETSP